MQNNNSELIGGPQDGASVTIGGTKPVPDIIYVGREYLGDAFAAWARELGDTKPCKYIRIQKKPSQHRYAGCYAKQRPE